MFPGDTRELSAGRKQPAQGSGKDPVVKDPEAKDPEAKDPEVKDLEVKDPEAKEGPKMD